KCATSGQDHPPRIRTMDGIHFLTRGLTARVSSRTLCSDWLLLHRIDGDVVSAEVAYCHVARVASGRTASLMSEPWVFAPKVAPRNFRTRSDVCPQSGVECSTGPGD